MYKSNLILSLVAAVGNNLEIGRDNKLLWRLPLDLKFYKHQTWGMTTLMGRRTYQSILNKKGRPPVGRQYIVVSRSWKGDQNTPEWVRPVTNLEAAFDYCEQVLLCQKIVIAGGQTIYKQALPYADELILTKVEQSFEDADTFFPSFAKEDWQLKHAFPFAKNEQNSIAFSFNYYIRKNNS